MKQSKAAIFVHPRTKQPLQPDNEGHLFADGGDRKELYLSYDGCYDFSGLEPAVRDARAAYDKFYARGGTERLTSTILKEPWFDQTVPWRRTMLESLLPLEGCRVLLLGNGESYKELYFLELGARIVFTDLSLVAARRAQAAFRASELYDRYKDRIEFHAVDAMHLPFASQTFDIIYGTKFVGFLPDLQQFFCEVNRCLKPGGKCRFCDDAYSPAWEAFRRNLVHPVKRLLRKSTPSLANIRTDSVFGFREDSLAPLVQQCQFRRLVFIREYFFLRVLQLCWGTVVRWNAKKLRYARPAYLTMRWIDQRLSGQSWMQRNQLALTWGFDK